MSTIAAPITPTSDLQVIETPIAAPIEVTLATPAPRPEPAAPHALRRQSGYPHWAINAGSLAAVAIGALWFVERTADLSLLQL